jgi:hypothetical protein
MQALSLDDKSPQFQTTRLSQADYEVTLSNLKKELEAKISKLPSVLKKILLDNFLLVSPTREVKIPLFDLFWEDQNIFNEEERKSEFLLNGLVRSLKELLWPDFSVDPNIQDWGVTQIAYLPAFELESNQFPVGAHTYGWPSWVFAETIRQQEERKNQPVGIIKGLKSKVAWFASKLVH